jgi:hypothetical protein
MREKAARKLKTGQIAIEFWDIWPRNMTDWTLPDEMRQRAVALRGAGDDARWRAGDLLDEAVAEAPRR